MLDGREPITADGIDVWIIACDGPTHAVGLIADARATFAAAKPILVLLQRGPGDVTRALLDDGADDVQDHRIATSELAARALALYRRSSRSTAAITQVGDLVVDISTRQATWRGAPLLLRPKVFDLLALLLQSAPGPVPSATIRKQLWSSDANGAKLRSVVWHLRQVLVPLMGPRAVTSVNNEGYALAQTMRYVAPEEVPAPSPLR
ncbi:winged helix-turn-helix domain-containing protein [Luteibacter yeojuensis]|uniref:winged helix-turn-helix domain-containing protein n=1 Tax=Luteibacter yeojuensis TaxID=345309 RepID=UPI003D18FA8F